MRISIGSDHAGYAQKEVVLAELQAAGHTLIDRGTVSEVSVDYPDHAHAVAKDVAEKAVDLGILFCGSGNGVNITANKHAGVRSALAWLPEIAALARQHNDANVVAIPARYVDTATAKGIVAAFLENSFEGGRHQRRVDAIERI